jgi:hypothetical protein
MRVNDTVQFPTLADLQTWTARDWTDGLQVDDLDQLETIEVVTRNTTYEIVVMDAIARDVLVRGGRFFPVYRRAMLSGASAGGSFLKVGGIYVGFRMELLTSDGPIITSPVRKISILEREKRPA